jgi:LmbE family N-acetylglucosaminyl deacetylase
MNDTTTPCPVLVIAAHPDDEVLGCGGTLALHRRAGHPVTVVIASNGRSAGAGGNGAGQHTYTHRALEALGVHDVRFLEFPDQGFDTVSLTQIITPLEQIVREVRPRVVYCQYGGDINRDHEILFKAILVATRPIEASIEAIYAFDTASSTEWAYPRSFVPDTWVEISATLDAKLAAQACYESELREYPHPRSLEALRHRAEAFGNQCCLRASEVFMTIRRVSRHGETPV